MSALRIFEKKIVLCKKGDEITGLDGTRLTGGLPPSVHSLLFNEICMFGLVCTGLDELLDGVASLEDYLC
jgi:hypothetical protein